MQLFETRFQAMGTACELKCYAADKQQAKQLSTAVIADVERLEAKYSRYRDSSELSRINRCAALGGKCEVDDETAALLDYADTCHRESEGLFDITSGILRRAWNFKSGTLPAKEQIDALLPHIGWQQLRWQRPWLEFPHSGMELDLGGIAKEYAADRAAAICAQLGVGNVLINLGGDIRVVGPQADGSAWRIGISDPQNPAHALCTLELKSGALASSGDYQRSITIDGVGYSHILNPLTGWPIRGLAAVSVVAELCVVAGSASTIAMLKGEHGEQWLKTLGVAYMCVDSKGTCSGPLNSR